MTDLNGNRRPPNIRIATILKALLFAIGMTLVLRLGTRIPPSVASISVADEINADYTVTLTIEVAGNPMAKDGLLCYVGPFDQVSQIPDSHWVPVENGQCQVDVSAGDYYVIVKDSLGNTSIPGSNSVAIKSIVTLSIDQPMSYLALNDTRQLTTFMFAVGDIDQSLIWNSSDASVVEVDQNGLVRAISPGTATITITATDGTTAECTVVSTDLIIRMQDSDESERVRLPDHYYTEEQAHMMETIFYHRIDEAGYETRAGVVAAARFLAMEFPFRVPYFYENGRLNNWSVYKRYVDGEGRFYHRGLYIHEYKFEVLDPKGIWVGPAIWGAPLTNFEDAGYFVPGQKYPNGLDCSGFVTWACLNGGWDVTDTGAGKNWGRTDDMCDYGIYTKITTDLLHSGKVKVGDLIGIDGHIAIIAGMDDTYIYIAESLGRGVGVNRVRLDQLSWSYSYDFICLMDTYYGGRQGNYEEMWRVDG